MMRNLSPGPGPPADNAPAAATWAFRPSSCAERPRSFARRWSPSRESRSRSQSLRPPSTPFRW